MALKQLAAGVAPKPKAESCSTSFMQGPQQFEQDFGAPFIRIIRMTAAPHTRPNKSKNSLTPMANLPIILNPMYFVRWSLFIQGFDSTHQEDSKNPGLLKSDDV